MFEAISGKEQLRLPAAKRYKVFYIPKKTGGAREISAPNSGLKQVQKRLAKQLLTAYQPRSGAHGYIPKRSILTNADPHVGSRYVLNIDLEDFFDSINFGRVLGIFRARPYLAQPDIAAVLAQICTHANKLPQGAPTSPIISNMICAKLDAQLRELARKYKCAYTRYCDDITFSTKKTKFPEEIARTEFSENKRYVFLGSELAKIIQQNGFKVKASKTRLLSKCDRQEVTGLVTNEFVNVKRTYIRNIRAALHAWKKYGPDKFQEEYEKKYFQGDPPAPPAKFPNVEDVLRGQIQFVGHVRGYDDQVYTHLRENFNALAAQKIRVNARSWQYKLENAVWVIEDELEAIQGTAFFAEGIGLVTCFHTVGKKPYIYNPAKSQRRYPVRMVQGHEIIDLAVLEVMGEQPEHTEFSVERSAVLMRESPVMLVGYPNHAAGKQLRVQNGEIASFFNRSAVERFTVTATIVGGNSGGPIFNQRRNVIGVAMLGGESESAADATDERAATRITMLRHLSPIIQPESESEMRGPEHLSASRLQILIDKVQVTLNRILRRVGLG